jgi:hypothetical protein
MTNDMTFTYIKAQKMRSKAVTAYFTALIQFVVREATQATVRSVSHGTTKSVNRLNAYTSLSQSVRPSSSPRRPVCLDRLLETDNNFITEFDKDNLTWGTWGSHRHGCEDYWKSIDISEKGWRVSQIMLPTSCWIFTWFILKLWRYRPNIPQKRL